MRAAQRGWILECFLPGEAEGAPRGMAFGGGVGSTTPSRPDSGAATGAGEPPGWDAADGPAPVRGGEAWDGGGRSAKAPTGSSSS
eukprot:1833751-Prorocentrum_lima.AAC.1